MALNPALKSLCETAITYLGSRFTPLKTLYASTTPSKFQHTSTQHSNSVFFSLLQANWLETAFEEIGYIQPVCVIEFHHFLPCDLLERLNCIRFHVLSNKQTIQKPVLVHLRLSICEIMICLRLFGQNNPHTINQSINK